MEKSIIIRLRRQVQDDVGAVGGPEAQRAPQRCRALLHAHQAQAGAGRGRRDPQAHPVILDLEAQPCRCLGEAEVGQAGSLSLGLGDATVVAKMYGDDQWIVFGGQLDPLRSRLSVVNALGVDIDGSSGIRVAGRIGVSDPTTSYVHIEGELIVLGHELGYGTLRVDANGLDVAGHFDAGALLDLAVSGRIGADGTVDVSGSVSGSASACVCVLWLLGYCIEDQCGGFSYDLDISLGWDDVSTSLSVSAWLGGVGSVSAAASLDLDAGRVCADIPVVGDVCASL